MCDIKTIYLGNLQTKIEHIQSSSSINTDADYRPLKNSFSSSELFVGAVTSCIITVMEATANKNGFSIGIVEAFSKKTMKENPKSISAIKIKIFFKNNKFTAEQKDLLKFAAYNCPVVLSLSSSIKKDITLIYE